MATHNISFTDLQKFPEGTSVGLYPVSNWPTPAQQQQPTGAPVGSPVANGTATVTSGVAAYTAVADGTYWATATSGGTHNYLFIDVATAVEPDQDLVHASNNLSELASASTARSNLGLGTASTHPAGDFIATSLVDAKGDLLVASADDTVIRKAVGSDAQVLTADAASTGGVKWASTSGAPSGAAGGDLGGTYPNPTLSSSLRIFNGWKPTGAKIETFPREFVTGGAVLLTSGTLLLTALAEPLRAGTTYTSISVLSLTAANTPTHQWFCLVDAAALTTLRTTTDDTGTAWAANTVKTLNLSSTYTPGADTNAYLGVMVTATTPPGSLFYNTNNTTLNGLAPKINGNSLTAQTTPPADATSVGTVTALGGGIWGYVS